MINTIHDFQSIQNQFYFVAPKDCSSDLLNDLDWPAYWSFIHIGLNIWDSLWVKIPIFWNLRIFSLQIDYIKKLLTTQVICMKEMFQ
jgi:hypothetical protein